MGFVSWTVCTRFLGAPSSNPKIKATLRGETFQALSFLFSGHCTILQFFLQRGPCGNLLVPTVGRQMVLTLAGRESRKFFSKCSGAFSATISSMFTFVSEAQWVSSGAFCVLLSQSRSGYEGGKVHTLHFSYQLEVYLHQDQM